MATPAELERLVEEMFFLFEPAVRKITLCWLRLVSRDRGEYLAVPVDGKTAGMPFHCGEVAVEGDTITMTTGGGGG